MPLFRLKVIAEGVETKGQARFLKLLKCDEMQSYLYSKPLPFEQITALLEAPPENVIPPGPNTS
ncbi:MAG: hypothetical protein Q8R61_04665 [Thiobacillus sp.]|uniref:hypothetical protein n=1 Tax=Thiobacillus sp. TaxID=924 RepID=UPI0027374E56|nr:hypothetical protein [Thiobacillus sp.]MDP3584395.1 hypothetical protein [Thiobacillus sp.]